MTVDVADFTNDSRQAIHMTDVRAGLYGVLKRALTGVGIDYDDCETEDRGDGALILIPATFPKSELADKLPDRLVTEIRRFNSTRVAEARMKLRVAVHSGDIRKDTHGWIGLPVNLAFRILDAHDAKLALRHSDGLLAMIASDHFYTEVIMQDPGTAPESYRQIEVLIKSFKGYAWLRLYGASETGPIPQLVPENKSDSIRGELVSAEELASARQSTPASDEVTNRLTRTLSRHRVALLIGDETGHLSTDLQALSRFVERVYRRGPHDALGLAELSTEDFEPDHGYLLVPGRAGNVLTESQLARLSQSLSVADAYAVITLADSGDRDVSGLGSYVVRAVTAPVAEEDVRPDSSSDVGTDVDWSTDAPADVDFLKRDALAKVLADRIGETRQRHAATSLLVHIDGVWGSGKSSLLNLMDKRLRDDFLVVRFDAWQQSRLSPPWWALLTAARQTIVDDRTWWARHWLRLKETGERARRSGAPYLLALVLLLVGAVGLGAIVQLLLSTTPKIELLRVAGPVTTAILAAWAGAKVASRMLLWNSAKGARLFEQSDSNPLHRVTKHFSWLLSQSRKPVVFFIDDLDRCEDDYVVELLESIQTLVRDTRQAQAYFVVSADGVWLRKSFACAYGAFADGDKAYNSIGYQFLDKFFQLSVPMPALSTSAQRGFLGRLLGLDEPAAPEAVAAAKARLDEAKGSEAQILEALAGIEDPGVREAVAADAALAVDAVETRQATEHQLRKFAPLLTPNPRSTKLFLNTYSMLRAVRTLEAITVDADALALWSILRVCYPSIADHLERNPESVQGIRDPLWCSEWFPEDLRETVKREGLRAIVTHPEGGPLTPELIRQCCGAS